MSRTRYQAQLNDALAGDEAAAIHAIRYAARAGLTDDLVSLIWPGVNIVIPSVATESEAYLRSQMPPFKLMVSVRLISIQVVDEETEEETTQSVAQELTTTYPASLEEAIAYVLNLYSAPIFDGTEYMQRWITGPNHYINGFSYGVAGPLELAGNNLVTDFSVDILLASRDDLSEEEQRFIYEEEIDETMYRSPSYYDFFEPNSERMTNLLAGFMEGVELLNPVPYV
jgi:hypothetical protein